MKKPKEKFKKIILSFWFWIIIALVFYIIFVLIPIQWTGNGLEVEEGTGFLKTLFAYLTKIAWIIAVALLIIQGIKSIQKSSIGEYWKIALTILGIIGIIVFTFFAVKDFEIFDRIFYEHDERIGDLDNEKMIRIHIELLEEDGYEVLYFGYLLEDTDLETAYLKMKSLGNRNTQVWEGLSSLYRIYPNAPAYSIKILEPMQECTYDISGNLYQAYGGSEEIELDGEVLDSLTLYQLINYQIDELGTCF